MPKMNIVEHKLINAPIDQVYATLNSMKTWQHWSPWLISDPDAKVSVADNDKSYEWKGNRVGSGNMHITQSNPNQSIMYDLTFLKPWKSEAKIQFTMEEKDGGTEVSWHMDSSLPWFMFWMKKMMVAFVGNDYKRGLNMLKDYVELGEVQSKINWIGEKDYPGCKFIGIKRSCSIKDMPKFMQSDFEKLMEFGREIGKPDDGFSQYHKFDFVKKQVIYTAGLPMDNIPASLPSEFITGELPAAKTYVLEHVGRYEHLGNAWTSIYSMHRNKEIKPLKGFHPFETYGNSPVNTEPKNLISYINFAIK